MLNTRCGLNIDGPHSRGKTNGNIAVGIEISTQIEIASWIEDFRADVEAVAPASSRL